jgi:hypothetical protein
MKAKILQSFPDPRRENMGGCKKFFYVETSKVISMPRVSGGKVNDLVELQEGAHWHAGYSTYRKLRFSEKMQENDSGKYFLTEITGFYPGNTPEALELFSGLNQLDLMLLVQDNNGNWRLCGSPDSPMGFGYGEDSGLQAADAAGLSFTFSSEHTGESPFYLVSDS